MTNNNELYRVYNKTKFSIGVQFPDGRNYNIKPNNFLLLDANDIAMIENQCSKKRFISQRMLVPMNEKDEPVDLMQVFRIQNNEEADEHMEDSDIKAKLAMTVKKVEAWLEPIEDETELYAIWSVAKAMDLPASKLKVLKAKIPNKEWLE